jgi:hypothetical protein
MEQRGRNQWQTFRSRRAEKRLELAPNRCHRLPPVAIRIRREKSAARTQADEATRTNVTDADILDRLRADAAKGDTRAAKEARDWAKQMAAGEGVATTVDVLFGDLDPQQQQRLFLEITRQACAALGIELDDETAGDVTRPL